MNNHILFKRKQQLEIYKEIQLLNSNRKTPLEELIAKYDSLFSELKKIDDEFNKANPSSYSWVIENERMSRYYGDLCVFHWGKTMNNDLWEKVKNHKSYLTSNDGVLFYTYLYTYLSIKSGRNQINDWSALKKYSAINDTGINIIDSINYYHRLRDLKSANALIRKVYIIFSDTITTINTLQTIKQLDSFFKPAKADYLKTFINSKDPKEQKIITELVLAHISTPWCKNVVKDEYQKSTDRLKIINDILVQSKSIETFSGFGQPVSEMPFGAKLYKLDNMKASELLANLKGSFKGKALLIDFWATWCAPCLFEMPYSKRLHNETKDLPIEFIYLCTSNNSSIDKWKTKIAELEITGFHIFVEETIETELMNLFSLSGYPGYVFINANGTFVPNAIVRPSSTNKDRIKELLKKNESH